MVWYSHLFKNFPQFVVIHAGFSVVNEAEPPRPQTVILFGASVLTEAIGLKFFKEMGIPGNLTCLLRNLYEGQEATVRT